MNTEINSSTNATAAVRSGRPAVAIVGRPNVGKSTLFNRIVGFPHAIVDDRPGITRDRNMLPGEWCGVTFDLIDTGGLEIYSKDEMLQKIKAQVMIAVESAEVIIMVIDGRAGLSQGDHEVASLLRSSGREIILAVNKIDDVVHEMAVYEFYSLGLGEPISISSIHGRGVGNLLDEVIARMPAVEEFDDPTPKIAIIGKPNVGKSTLLNRIAGEDRSIVDSTPGTTRDAIDSRVTIDGREYVFIDTAGLRKKSKVYDDVERYAVLRSFRAVERADVVLLLLDIGEGVSEQEEKIAGISKDKGKGLILVVNKWDRVKKGGDLAGEMTTIQKHYEEQLRKKFIPFSYAEITFISAATGQGTENLIPMADLIMREREKRIQTSHLNEFFKNVTFYHPPPRKKGEQFKIFYSTQANKIPPTFVLFVNKSNLLHFSYRRYLENCIREEFGFKGTPIKIITREEK